MADRGRWFLQRLTMCGNRDMGQLNVATVGRILGSVDGGGHLGALLSRQLLEGRNGQCSAAKPNLAPTPRSFFWTPPLLLSILDGSFFCRVFWPDHVCFRLSRLFLHSATLTWFRGLHALRQIIERLSFNQHILSSRVIQRRYYYCINSANITHVFIARLLSKMAR